MNESVAKIKKFVSSIIGKIFTECKQMFNSTDRKEVSGENVNESEMPNSIIGKVFSTIGKVISVIFAVIFIIASLFAFGDSFVAGICFLLLGLLLLPYTKKLIHKKTGNNTKLRKWVNAAKIIALVLLFFVGGSALPKSDTNYAEQHWSALTAMSEAEKEDAFRTAVRSGVSFYITWNYDVKENHNIDISTVEVNGNTYTAYGKVTVTDNYGDSYTGKFTAVYEFDENTQKFDKKSVDVSDLIKN